MIYRWQCMEISIRSDNLMIRIMRGPLQGLLNFLLRPHLFFHLFFPYIFDISNFLW